MGDRYTWPVRVVNDTNSWFLLCNCRDSAISIWAEVLMEEDWAKAQ